MKRSIGSIGIAAAGALTFLSVPAIAAPAFTASATGAVASINDVVQHSRGQDWRGDRYGNQYGNRRYYDEPVYRNTPVWRGRDGRTYCRKRDGTTGLIIGGAVGALLGREIDGGYNRSTGTILGAAGGALLGRHVARNGGRCR